MQSARPPLPKKNSSFCLCSFDWSDKCPALISTWLWWLISVAVQRLPLDVTTGFVQGGQSVRPQRVCLSSSQASYQSAHSCCVLSVQWCCGHCCSAAVIGATGRKARKSIVTPQIQMIWLLVMANRDILCMTDAGIQYFSSRKYEVFNLVVWDKYSFQGGKSSTGCWALLDMIYWNGQIFMLLFHLNVTWDHLFITLPFCKLMEQDQLFILL